MDRHQVRRWLGSVNLGEISLPELNEYFSIENMVRLFGTTWSFDEMEEAKTAAIKMWYEIHGKA